MKKLPRDFFSRDTISVAKDLLGALLIRHYDGVDHIGRIVEVEAYLGLHDLASHSSKGITPRTKTMYGPPGRAYVYLIYGMHHCMNVVTEPEGRGTAVLIRAIEPVLNVVGNTRGPGLLCKAMQIDKSLNDYDLAGDLLYIAARPLNEAVSIVERPRIGIHYAGEWVEKPLRFYIKDNPFVSKK